MDFLFKITHPSLLYPNASYSFTFIIPSIIHVILSFVLLGMCASDYLCPNVAQISELNRSSVSTRRRNSRTQDNSTNSSGVLMAVLLSWCNSSPDLFSNLMSWTTTPKSSDPSLNAAALSIGEVLGACGIILCIVEGSIFIVMSRTNISINKLQRRNLLKDLSFTTIAMCFMTYISLRNRVTILNCLLMCFVYVTYLVGKFSHNESKFISINDEENIIHEHGSASSEQIDEQMEASSDPFMDLSTNQLNTGIKPSLISAMDYQSLLSILESSDSNSNLEIDYSEDANELSTLSQENVHNTTIDNKTSIPYKDRPISEPIKSNLNNNNILPQRQIQTSPATFQPYSDTPETQRDDVFNNNNTNNNNQLTNNETILAPPVINIHKPRNRRKIKRIQNSFLKIFLPHLLNFRKKSILHKILSILTIPFVIILRMSCPHPSAELVEFDENLQKYIYSKLELMTLFIQGSLCPFVPYFLLSSLLFREPRMWLITLPSIIALCYIVLVISFYQTIRSHNKFSIIITTADQESEINEKSQSRRSIESLNTIINITFLSIGILNSILYISVIANSLIEMMEIYQSITGISKAILGLTIFAWGNSISDLISNIAMCRLYLRVPHQDDIEHITKIATKFFIISITSCLGGVMLNSMGGIGFSGLIAMLFIHKGSNYWWFLRYVELKEGESTTNYNHKFIVSCIGIIIQLIILIIIFGGPDQVREWAQRKMRLLGIIMCNIWGVATLCNVLFELFT
ncbi:Ecm27p NDAI_0D00330 [Naumovozyma dairenensis CBS 421]|uniref:Sodium/calcium exchanger membrane region domain-containing protein n=1 Tax=Naumovozyma dairenensis (strain ATCC 10597 / BCRC 20456 / CBS 421 / NBRC 0211 / NRRL Y-12639) TaxID=1071378 RepID=G0W986_NAUDC|nr:hypothetical protein NDAI_0D00330 [Naumovozyma dairenensis CBS 421]CCD24347.1 hypothetical protein NDAI_0D00330 [Naumovozyma dairenensis CBS 421]